MTNQNTHLADGVEAPDDSDSPLSYEQWIEGLPQDTRRSMREYHGRRRTLKASGDAEDESAEAPTPAQMFALLTEIRDLLVNQRQVRDHYSTEEVAQILGKANWTVREWCRQGRVNAEKRRSGRGRSYEWVIPHAELLRIQKEGLLPVPEH